MSGARQLCGEAGLCPIFAGALLALPTTGVVGGVHMGVTVHLEMRYLGPSIVEYGVVRGFKSCMP
jgi:hypothetical protein